MTKQTVDGELLSQRSILTGRTENYSTSHVLLFGQEGYEARTDWRTGRWERL
jgi:hypothetical protein